MILRFRTGLFIALALLFSLEAWGAKSGSAKKLIYWKAMDFPDFHSQSYTLGQSWLFYIQYLALGFMSLAAAAAVLLFLYLMVASSTKKIKDRFQMFAYALVALVIGYFCFMPLVEGVYDVRSITIDSAKNWRLYNGFGIELVNIKPTKKRALQFYRQKIRTKTKHSSQTRMHIGVKIYLAKGKVYRSNTVTDGSEKRDMLRFEKDISKLRLSKK